jgi:hypothetical protein
MAINNLQFGRVTTNVTLLCAHGIAAQSLETSLEAREAAAALCFLYTDDDHDKDGSDELYATQLELFQ